MFDSYIIRYYATNYLNIKMYLLEIHKPKNCDKVACNFKNDEYRDLIYRLGEKLLKIDITMDFK